MVGPLMRGKGHRRGTLLREDTTTEAQSELLKAMSSLLEDGKYSDMTITCNDHTFNLHRSIVCPRAAYFSTACNGNFHEAESGKFELDDDLPLVQRMIDYLYKLDYSETIEQESLKTRDLAWDFDQVTATPEAWDEMPAAIVNAQMYAIADKYRIAGLKGLSKKKLEATVTNSWNNESFSDVVRKVYECTPPSDRGLRDVVAMVARQHIHALRDRGEFKSVLSGVPDFTLDVLNKVVDGIPDHDLDTPSPC